METSVGVGGKRAGGSMEEEGLNLGFGSSSAFSVGLAPQKLVRTQEFPFRMVAPAPCPSGPTLFYGGSCDAYEAASAPQPLPSPSRPPSTMGEGGATAAGLRSLPFTQAQWQELQRQAMIYKHFVASVPVPTELLFPMSPSSFPDAPPHLLPFTLMGQGGGASFNVRSGNSGDLEPGRCRRTDGKKWRCARDVAPGQKYCERHVHRGRPRSRKPVELYKPKPTTATAASSSTPGATTTATGNSPSARTTTTTVSQAFPVHSTGFLPKPALKLPFMSMEPTKDPRYLDWTKENGQMAPSHQWELMQSKIGLRSNNTPVVQHYDDQFNLNYTDLNDQYCGFLNPNLSLEEDTMADQREPPRSFIDAWSTETLTAATSCDKSCTTSSGKLPLSTLSLSMCGGVEEDAERVQMGLGLGDSVAKSQLSTWMAPGPLGEVLQSSNVTSPQHGSNNCKGSCGGGLTNIMSRGCCGNQEASPQESPTRLASSPSGVLQKGLVSLSDSSCSSSPTFAAAASRPEFTLQWVDQSK